MMDNVERVWCVQTGPIPGHPVGDVLVYGTGVVEKTGAILGPGACATPPCPERANISGLAGVWLDVGPVVCHDGPSVSKVMGGRTRVNCVRTSHLKRQGRLSLPTPPAPMAPPPAGQNLSRLNSSILQHLSTLRCLCTFQRKHPVQYHSAKA